MVLGGIFDAGHDVGQRARANDGQRLDLVDAGVAGVELQEDVVAADVALDESAQVVLDSFPFLIHVVIQRVLTVGVTADGLHSEPRTQLVTHPHVQRLRGRPSEPPAGGNVRGFPG